MQQLVASSWCLHPLQPAACTPTLLALLCLPNPAATAPCCLQFTDKHKPHSPTTGYAPHTHAIHLPAGPAVNPHARPVSPTDDATGGGCTWLRACAAAPAAGSLLVGA